MNKTTNKEMVYFNVIGLNKDQYVHIRVYLKSKFQMIEEGLSYKFANIVKKDDQHYWAVSHSTIAYSSIVETDEKMERNPPSLPEEIPEEGQELTLQKAMVSPEKSVVVGKVVMVSPLRFRQNGTLPVRSLMLKDQETRAKVCLFGANAQSHYTSGDTLKISALYPKMHRDQMQLTTTVKSTCEFVCDQFQVTIDEQDKEAALNDPDFQELLPEEQEMKEITITDFVQLDIYDCCDMPPCRKKKIINGSCPICSKTTTCMKTFKGVFLYEVGGKKDQSITLFQTTLEKIVGDNLEPTTKGALINTLVQKLPIRFKAIITDKNNLISISH